MHAQPEKVMPHPGEIATLLRGGSAKRLNPGSKAVWPRGSRCNLGVIVLGAGCYGRGHGLVARSPAGFVHRTQIPANHFADDRRQRG